MLTLENFPGCCTSAILFSLGEHNEKSEMYDPNMSEADKINKIKQMVTAEMNGGIDLGGAQIEGHKRCVFAISVDPANVRLLKKCGFRIVDTYPGIQGLCRIMTLHVGDGVRKNSLMNI
jgi:hypothetical protein